RTCQAMHNADEQRAQNMKESQPFERSAQSLRSTLSEPARRHEPFAMMIPGRCMRMPMKVYSGAVFLDVRMFSGHSRMCRGEFLADPFHRAGEVEHAEQNQHQTHGKFHRQADTHWNCQAK